jgi:hypothetical protein
MAASLALLSCLIFQYLTYINRRFLSTNPAYSSLLSNSSVSVQVLYQHTPIEEVVCYKNLAKIQMSTHSTFFEMHA